MLSNNSIKWKKIYEEYKTYIQEIIMAFEVQKRGTTLG